MERMDSVQFKKMMLSVADRIIRNEEYLTRIDSAVGDGDHGIGMKNGMSALIRYLKDVEENDINALYTGMADAMQEAMGGASGMIFSTLFAGKPKEKGPVYEISPVDFALHLKGGLEAIKELGHAETGDKTMIDALAPAVDAMLQNTDTFEGMFTAGEKAAKAGKEKTRDLVARFGRAKNLGERTLGHEDPGAVSTWLILLEMRDFVTGEKTADPAIPVNEDQGLKAFDMNTDKKIINDPENVVKEETEGFLAAYGKDYEQVEGVNGLKKREIPEGKTVLIIGGGSGHEPMFGFLLGKNLADAAANGNIFTSPDPITIQKTAEAAERGGGVLFLYGNYAGDNLNFDKAARELEKEGIPSRTVRVKDDVASAPKERFDDRRGIAGDLLILKIAGGACSELSLEEAYRVTQKANANLWTVGVGLAGATIPGKKEPIFTLPADEMEYGLGIHGEPGIKRVKMKKADEIVDELLRVIIEDSGLSAGDRVCTYVNGLGGTTLMELMIMNRRLRQQLDAKGITVHDMEVNSLVTTLEMAGASVSILRLDDELQHYYDLPCRSPYYNKF